MSCSTPSTVSPAPDDTDPLLPLSGGSIPVAAVVAAVALAGALAGCGGGSGSGGSGMMGDGSGTMSGAPATTSSGSSPTATTSSDAAEQDGRALFLAGGCGGCHTLAAAGSTGTTGPNLDQVHPSYDLVVRWATDGGGGMPSFAGSLSDAQIDAIARYVSGAAR